MNVRISRLNILLRRLRLDALLISSSSNIFYLTGFSGHDSYCLISGSGCYILTDFRYVEQARAQAPEFETVQTRGEFAAWLPGLIAELGVKKLGFEASDISFAVYRKLAEAAGKGENQLIPVEGLVEPLRAVKEAEELACMEKAAELADAVFEYIVSVIHPGMKEKEVAWEIERFLREKGSGKIPFEIIVASGPNAALPHALPAERVIGSGEPIVLDLGARVEGYCSDFTRTLCLGRQDGDFARVYDLVLGAQLTALATLEAGMDGTQADQLARTVIEQGGYGDAFGHGLGHGLGLDVHEAPRLGPNSSDILCEGMTFTVEPGVYLSGWGGVRIEDTVVLQGGKPRRLTKADK